MRISIHESLLKLLYQDILFGSDLTSRRSLLISIESLLPIINNVLNSNGNYIFRYIVTPKMFEMLKIITSNYFA